MNVLVEHRKRVGIENGRELWNLHLACGHVVARTSPGRGQASASARYINCPECDAAKLALHRIRDAAPDLLAACRQFASAYAKGESNGGSVDWSDIDDAHALAVRAIAKAEGKP